MFDFAWSEIGLIGVVALIAIGPKDMPAAIKAVTGVIKKARRMAGEFQTHVDEMMREADLQEVRDQINEIRNFDIKGEIEKAIDEDGSIRATLNENPLESLSTPLAHEPAADATVVAESEAATVALEAAPEAGAAEPHLIEAPAFIPPEIANRPEAPPFIPPSYARS
jgi:sec-independent protein translocase protein TatB